MMLIKISSSAAFVNKMIMIISALGFCFLCHSFLQSFEERKLQIWHCCIN